MATSNRPIAFHAGNDVDLPFTVSDADTIVGCSYTWRLYALGDTDQEPADGAEPALEYETADMTLNTDDMVVTVQVAKDDTAALASGRYYHSLEETRPSGATLVIATGVVQLRPNV